jgi:hypothetical protein
MNDFGSQGDDQSRLTHEEICRLPHLKRIHYAERIRIRYPLWVSVQT